MAINTDATFGKSALGEREVSHPTDFQDTEKLLSIMKNEPSGQSNLKRSDSFSLNMRGSIRSLDADLTGHMSPFKSGSVGTLGAPPVSPTRLSLGPALSPLPPDAEPPSYLWLAIISCFCLSIPVNMLALWYAHVSRSVLQTGDVESARKSGRISLACSCIAILLGVGIYTSIVISDKRVILVVSDLYHIYGETDEHQLDALKKLPSDFVSREKHASK